MSTYTAQIIIGSGHPNHGGVMPDAVIYLSENGKPALVLKSDRTEIKRAEETVWIPTLEKPLDDAMLMIGACVLQDQALLEKIRSLAKVRTDGRVELYKRFNSAQLETLYAFNRDTVRNYGGLKLVFSIFEGSLFTGKIESLGAYEVDLEVSLSVYNRFYSGWRDEVVVRGNLEG